MPGPLDSSAARRSIARIVFPAWIGCSMFVVSLAAQEANETDPEKKLAQQRLDLMQQRMQQFTVSANAEGFPERFERNPLFRYDDPARGYVAAALWKLGEKGRPLAIISTELQPRYQGKPRIVYEYLALTERPFVAASPDYRWVPATNALEFKPIPDSPAPAETERQRLVQMRAEARRFTMHEVVGGQRYELRLLPQPIDRYTPSAAERADGAIFVLAFGTNPEALLFVESDGTNWEFAIGRLSGSSLISAQIGEAVVWEIGRVVYAANSSYTASNAAANIPGIAADGSVLPAP